MKLKIQLFSILLLWTLVSEAQWHPQFSSIATRWGKEVTPENAWQEYPRPQMIRESWLNLNGLWDFSVQSNAANEQPAKWQGKILVPFSIEAPLSGVARQMSVSEAIWYKRSFTVPEDWKDKQLVLHFDAADFETTVWLNGRFLGVHKGGYLPFSFTVSQSMLNSGPQNLLVKVYDPQDSLFRSIGKQGSKISDYERCSGLWQTVWIEPVSARASFRSLKIDANLKEVSVTPVIDGNAGGLKVTYEVFDNGALVASQTGNPDETTTLKIINPKPWSPDYPFLYDLRVTLTSGNQVTDQVISYFGMRTIALASSEKGTEILLNGKPVFQIGPLDQNYWPDGGFTPPADVAMQWEAEYLKRIGCNMVRLHIKRNPDRYYYHCDQLGLLVWQDLVCGKFGMKNPPADQSDFWLREQKQLMSSLYNHPSVVLWVVFNESWGQHDSKRIFDELKPLDTTRLFNIASGWNDVPGVGDIRDIHDYTFRPAIPAPGDEKRAVVLGECGGFASAVPSHNWTGRSNKTGIPANPLHGGFDPEIPRDDNAAHDIFRPTFTIGEPFQKQYRQFIENLRLLKNSGLTAAVYTQMTDMKLEENGWLTFDREVSKIQPDSLRAIHKLLYSAPPRQKVLLPSSMEKAQSWEVCQLPVQEIKDRAKEKGISVVLALQEIPNFNGLKWEAKQGPFGNTPDLSVRTSWDGKTELLIRKKIEINDTGKNYSFRIYTKMEGEGTPWMHSRIYINNQFVADETTRLIMPELRMAEVRLPEEAKKYLKNGLNEIAVQFVPGLVSRSGKIEPASEKVYVDVELTEIENL